LTTNLLFVVAHIIPIPVLTIMVSANGTFHSELPEGHFLFTSESVGEGHPGIFSSFPLFFAFLMPDERLADKICDQVSDAIVSSRILYMENMYIEDVFHSSMLAWSKTRIRRLPARPLRKLA